jgi:oligopeptide transport system ATP-binding protein
MPDLLLDVRGLETQFRTPDGIVHAVNGVSFNVKEGETPDMVGESGCGRNAAMLSVLGLIPDSPGKVTVGKALF